MICSFEFYKNDKKVRTGLYKAKEVFGENVPYIFEQRFDGKVVVFSQHFIRTIREALTNGCMAKMNNAEEELFQDLIDYENGSVLRDISGRDYEVLAALDEWLNFEILCKEHPVVNGCYSSDTHEWEECSAEMLFPAQ